MVILSRLDLWAIILIDGKHRLPCWSMNRLKVCRTCFVFECSDEDAMTSRNHQANGRVDIVSTIHLDMRPRSRRERGNETTRN